MVQSWRPRPIRISILTFSHVFVWLILFYHVPKSIAGGSFDPFMDSNLFSINWEGPLDLNEEEVKILGDRHMVVTTNKDEKYECILPENKKTTKDSADEYTGPSAEELIRPLVEQTQCSYRIESYWTYELCHGKHLKQYHETKEQGSQAKVQEYYLGFGNHRELKQDNDASDTYSENTETEKKLPVKELEGEELPYFEIIMSDGTKCDLTNTPRKTHVFYVCHNGGRGEMYELKESSTCVYEVLVLTAQLCKHPSYRPKRPPVTEVRCHAVLGSPMKPSELTKVERETQILSKPGQDYVLSKQQPQTQIEKGEESESEKYPLKKMIRKPVSAAEPKPPSASAQPHAQEGKLGAVTDKQTLRDFFKGHTCLRGGTGWWKHEICFGRYVKQYHMEPGKQTTDIFLGHWDQENHLEWLRQNPAKKPKDPLIRKYVSLLYTNGQICDLTKKPRICEIRLRCVTASKNPHAMVLSLIEPKPCEYIMTVESALFCSVLKEADEDGLFHFDKMDL